MFATVAVLTLFFAFPIALGYVENVRSTPEKRMWYYRQVQAVESWTATDYSLAGFIACTVLLYIAGFLTMAGVKLGVAVYFLLMLIVSISALVYLCCYWKISVVFQGRIGFFNKVFGVVAIGVATISKIYSDMAIAELTGLPPQNFPGAQLLLTFILTPAIWFMGLSLILGYLSFPVMIFLFFRSLYFDFIGVKNLHEKRPSLPGVTAFLAVALFAVITLTVTQKLASKNFYENRLKQAIAFASFHLPNSYCGLSEISGGGLATMADDRAAIAVPDGKNNYSFEVVSCKPKVKTSDEINVMLEKISSAQTK